jgi:hypothetical protein
VIVRADRLTAGGNITEEQSEPQWNKAAGALLGLAFVVGGVYAVVTGVRLPVEAGGGDARWIALLLGIGLGGIGALFIARFLDLGEKAPLAIVMGCVAIGVNFAVFIWVMDWLRSVGGRHGVALARIFVVAVDLYLAYALATQLLRRERHVAGAIGAVAIAVVLHFAGVLDRLGWTSSRLPLVSSGILEARRIPPSQPQAPYKDFAGTWQVGFNMFGASWISRVEIQLHGEKAKATVWRACGKKDCEAGTYDARFEPAKPGQAHALHFIGHTAGYDWMGALIPTPYGMVLSERRIRGTDWNTHSQQVPQVKRIAP